MNKNIREIDHKDFEKDVLNGKNVIIDFYSTECPPCDALATKFETLSEIFNDQIKFFKIFRQQNRELAGELGVSGSPTLLFFKDGKETGKRLSGSIKLSDITVQMAYLIDKSEIEQRLNSITKVESKYSVTIIGGGPAGLTAAIYLGQAHVKTVVIDQALYGGNVAITHSVSNYPGFSEPVNGYMLAHHINEQAKKTGVDFRYASDVNEIDLYSKTIRINNYETIKSDYIILATGTSPNLLGIPGEIENRGKGVSYCATCDGKYYQDMDIAVIGGGNSAVEEALFLTKFARTVTIIHRRKDFRANKEALELMYNNPKIRLLLDHEVKSIHKKGTNDINLQLFNKNTNELSDFNTAGVFIFIGLKPNTYGIKGNLKLDNDGYIITDNEMATGISGVYAAGDLVSKPVRQITTAVSDGTIAAVSISKKI